MSIARHHADWLSLLEISGPFLSMPVLLRAFPQGLDAHDTEITRSLRMASDEWADNQQGLRPDPAIHAAWVRFVLRDVLDFTDDLLLAGPAIPEALKATIAEQGEALRPDLIIQRAGYPPRLLIQIVLPAQDLDKPLKDHRWKASPATRMAELLRATGVRLGLVTNGERWMLVHAQAGETSGFISWYASLWLDEPVTLRAFRSLLGIYRAFGVPDGDTLKALLTESAANQQEVTDQLGYQVRQAVEVLVQTFDRTDKDSGRTLLVGVAEATLYEAALTVMMRLVFLFSAEERGLLLLGKPMYDQYYAVSTLRAQLREVAEQVGEEVMERRSDAWSRLLATFRAVHGGVQHEDLRLLAYGGNLFDPDRFAFLEGRMTGTSWHTTPARPAPIDNRTVLHLLEALQILRISVPGGGPAEPRRLSFRALDIEQIGHVYEGLLDHTAKRAAEPVLGLAGTKDREPENPLAELERRAYGVKPTPATMATLDIFGNGATDATLRENKALIEFLREETGRSASALANALSKPLERRDLDALRAACDNDAALAVRVTPFAGLLRPDNFGRPVVITAGSVYVTAGTDRRSSGTHYTPRSLTEPIVQHTLEPLAYHGPAEGLPREQWQLHPAADLLQLTVCDMAMGSGAFLVQACRYLSERLLEAWAAAEGADDDKRRLMTSEGFLATNPDEAIPADPDERLVFARRLVADRCLYGVDKNPLAVEMAKLSLWLITLAKGQPFSFLDHALRCGDSLLGISEIGQLTHWSLDKGDGAAPRQTTFITQQIEEALQVALRERRKIAGMRVREARDADLKAGWLATAEAALALAKLGADLLVASALHPNPKQRDGLRKEWLGRYPPLLSAAEDTRAGRLTVGGQADVANRAAYSSLRHEADEHLAGRKPFHWPLEFPEVFVDGSMAEGDTDVLQRWAVDEVRGQIGSELLRIRPKCDAIAAQRHAEERAIYAAARPACPGFAAIVGNPPFQGGQKITGALGVPYRDYLVEYLASDVRGSADLCAYFFLRGGSLAQQNGQLGLIATNTIAQGDTREVGLDQLAAQGFNIPRAVPSRPWPGTAALEVAQVWLRRGPWHNQHVLNDQPTTGITSFLTTPGASSGKPYRLNANESKSFQGSIVLGMGFVLEPEEAAALISKDPRNREVLFPYLNGEDLNSRFDQSPSRWVINFHDWPLERAETYPDAMRIVREKVKPERDRNNRAQRRERWWQYAERAPALYATIAGMERVLITARVSPTNAVILVPNNLVFHEKIVVFPDYSLSFMSLMQSSIHWEWARQYTSTLGAITLNYSPSDCFETFPFPASLAGGNDAQRKPDTRHPTPDTLSTIGERYHEHRKAVMVQRQEGLTKTYNGFHDPAKTSADIAELRRLHVEMDQAVAAAYGWADLDLGHGFHQTKQGLRYTIGESARRTVLDRLLALNHERYAEEVKAGMHDKGAKKAKVQAKKSVAQPVPYSNAPQLPLGFGETQPIEPTVETTIIDFWQTTEQLARKRAAEERETYEVAASMPPVGMETTQPTSNLPVLDRNVIVLARTIEKHQQHGFEKTLGHVKAEKILHIVEAHSAVDLGRSPTRMAAGPADFDHLLAVAAYGKKLGAFQDIRRPGDRKAYQFIPLPGLELTASRMEEAFGPHAAGIDDLIERFVGLDTDESEIVATLYAAWNDLLAAGEEVTEERLFKEFYTWDESKSRFQPGGLRQMKAWMESWGIVPSGKAKRTLPRESV
jgi:hypothetical protein